MFRHVFFYRLHALPGRYPWCVVAFGIRFLIWHDGGGRPTESDRVGAGFASGVRKDPLAVTVVRIIRLGLLPRRGNEFDGYNIF
jgi:hypothetical protein